MKKALWIVLTVIIVLSIVQLSANAVTNYSYEADIKSLVSSKDCGNCHSFMESYNNMTTEVISGKKLINTDDPASSLLIWQIEGKDSEGNAYGPRMPADGPYFSETEIQIFKDWITQGAPLDIAVGVEDTRSWLDVKKQFQ
jgi:hypothetical protein